MAGAIGAEWRPLTLRELVIRYDSHLLSTWDHTALIVATVEGLSATVQNFAAGWSKHKGKAVKPRSFSEIHPYRETEQAPDTGDRMKLDKSNIRVLKSLFASRN